MHTVFVIMHFFYHAVFDLVTNILQNILYNYVVHIVFGGGVTIHPTNSNSYKKWKSCQLSHYPMLVKLLPELSSSAGISSQGLLIKGTGFQHQTFIWVSLEQLSTSCPLQSAAGVWSLLSNPHSHLSSPPAQKHLKDPCQTIILTTGMRNCIVTGIVLLIRIHYVCMQFSCIYWFWFFHIKSFIHYKCLFIWSIIEVSKTDWLPTFFKISSLKNGRLQSSWFQVRCQSNNQRLCCECSHRWLLHRRAVSLTSRIKRLTEKVRWCIFQHSYTYTVAHDTSDH